LRQMKRILLIVLILLGISLLIITGEYLRVEYLTKKYVDNFVELSFFQVSKEVEYIKILKYSEISAKIFVVEKGWDDILNDYYRAGNYYYLTKTNNVWELESWDTVWSQAGSADDISWPPYF